MDGLPQPTADTAALEWRRPTYRVVARVDSAGDVMTLSLRDSVGHTWVAGRLPAGPGQIYWLDQPPLDSAARHGLARAFDEAVFYSDDARSAALPHRPREGAPRVAAVRWTRSQPASAGRTAHARQPSRGARPTPRLSRFPSHRPSHHRR